MNIRLYNARILTMEPGREVFYGEVWVKNDKIAYVAEQKELAEEWDKSQFPRIAWDIELDCKGNLLMPGFKNALTAVILRLSVWAPSVQMVSSFWPATSSFVSAALTSSRVRMSARAAMIPCLLWSMAPFVSSAWARAARSAASSSNFFLKSATQRAGPSWPGSF